MDPNAVSEWKTVNQPLIAIWESHKKMSQLVPAGRILVFLADVKNWMDFWLIHVCSGSICKALNNIVVVGAVYKYG